MQHLDSVGVEKHGTVEPCSQISGKCQIMSVFERLPFKHT